MSEIEVIVAILKTDGLWIGIGLAALGYFLGDGLDNLGFRTTEAARIWSSRQPVPPSRERE